MPLRPEIPPVRLRESLVNYKLTCHEQTLLTFRPKRAVTLPSSDPKLLRLTDNLNLQRNLLDVSQTAQTSSRLSQCCLKPVCRHQVLKPVLCGKNLQICQYGIRWHVQVGSWWRNHRGIVYDREFDEEEDRQSKVWDAWMVVGMVWSWGWGPAVRSIEGRDGRNDELLCGYGHNLQPPKHKLHFNRSLPR